MILPGWILLGCLAAQPAAGRSVTSERLYHSGMQAMKAREYKDALEHFMDAILIDPDYPDARERMREAGEELLRIERTRANREREFLMIEIEAAQHSIGASRQLGRGGASPSEQSEPPPEDAASLPPPEPELSPPWEDAEIAPPPRPARKRRPRRGPKPVAEEGSGAEAAQAVRVGHFKQTVHMDLDWLPPRPSQVPPPDTGELYLKGIRAYSAGDLASAIAAWEECLKVEPGHAKARKALERAKREAQGGRR